MALQQRTLTLDSGAAIPLVAAKPPKSAKASGICVILAHGAGANMDSDFICAAHEGLAERGHWAVKFNFPYTAAGKKAPDRTPILEACFRTVVASVRDKEGRGLRLVLGGKSMGGRMASHLSATDDGIDGLLLLGYPLHPPGKPDKLRDAHLPCIPVPMLFFAGTRDPLSRLDLLETTLKKLNAPHRLHIVEGGDHSFKVLKSLGRSPEETMDEILDVADEWLRRLA